MCRGGSAGRSRGHCVTAANAGVPRATCRRLSAAGHRLQDHYGTVADVSSSPKVASKARRRLMVNRRYLAVNWRLVVVRRWQLGSATCDWTEQFSGLEVLDVDRGLGTWTWGATLSLGTRQPVVGAAPLCQWSARSGGEKGGKDVL